MFLTTVSDLFLAFLELSAEVMLCERCRDGSFENAYSLHLSPMTRSDSLFVATATATLLRGTQYTYIILIRKLIITTW